MHLVHSRRPDDEPDGDAPDKIAERAAAALHAAGHGIKPPPWLAPRGLARGRRSRRIRVLAAACGVATAAAVGTGVVLALPNLAGPRDAAPSAQRSADVPPSPIAVPKPFPTHPRDAAAERLLRKVLPPEVSIADVVSREEDNGVSFTGVLSDEQGSGSLAVVLASGHSVDELTCGQTSGDASCRPMDLADGARIRIETHRDPQVESAGPAGTQGIQIWSVQLIRPDGTSVEATATDSNPERMQRTRPTPILTTDQLRELVTAAEWSTYAAS